MLRIPEKIKEQEGNMEVANVWVRFAGNARNIKANEHFHWRVYIEGVPYGVLLEAFSLEGEIGSSNFIPETESGGQPLSAWLRAFGDLTIENHVAVLRLRNP